MAHETVRDFVPWEDVAECEDDINDTNDLVSELNTENTVATPNSFAGWSEVSSKLKKEGVSYER